MADFPGEVAKMRMDGVVIVYLSVVVMVLLLVGYNKFRKSGEPEQRHGVTAKRERVRGAELPKPAVQASGSRHVVVERDDSMSRGELSQGFTLDE